MEVPVNSKQRCCFIINNSAGTSSIPGFERQVKSLLNSKLFTAEFFYSDFPGHASEIAEMLVKDHVPYIVAVGGDGTINQVGSKLVHSKSTLAIIPTGSGNGFARHLKIPLNIEDAIKLINKRTIKTIDTGLINNKPFLNIAGVGFDAFVANNFALDGKRGFWGYAKAVMREFSKFKSGKIILDTEEGEYEQEAFMICFANGQQFGNRLYVSPKASMSDGKLDVCMFKKPQRNMLLTFVYKMMNKKELSAKYFKEVKSKIAVLHHDFEYFHIDGEPFRAEKKIIVKCIPSSLTVLVSR